MGISIFKVADPNPNPYKYKILKVEPIRGYLIIEALYFGCTTFEGRKLLLFKGLDLIHPLDPHLLGGSHPVVARFEPNEKGWRLARLCALYLSENSHNKI